MGNELAVEAVHQLSDVQRREVEDLVATAARADGFAALNEAGHLHLRHPRPEVTHVLARLAPGLAGYAQLEVGARITSGQLVVAPEHRRHGIGSALLGRLLERSDGRLQMWALSDPPAAAALAGASGLVRSRVLLRMTRSLDDPVPGPEIPPGVALRSFRPGQDEDAWLRVNARAFADHPEQGTLTAADLADRMAEPWFDPAGFLLAEAGSELVAFHWTKQHPDHLGEVYVLGVDPDAGGRGLGRALLLAGLRHLAADGNRTVQLYVEADHDRAVRLYRRHGFEVASRDVMYAQATQENR